MIDTNSLIVRSQASPSAAGRAAGARGRSCRPTPRRPRPSWPPCRRDATPYHRTRPPRSCSASAAARSATGATPGRTSAPTASPAATGSRRGAAASGASPPRRRTSSSESTSFHRQLNQVLRTKRGKFEKSPRKDGKFESAANFKWVAMKRREIRNVRQFLYKTREIRIPLQF